MRNENPANLEVGGVEITFSYPRVAEWGKVQITNSRQWAIRLMESEYIPFFTPQMFLQESGVYGLHLSESPIAISKEGAEKELEDFGQSVRESNQRISYPSGAIGSDHLSDRNA